VIPPQIAKLEFAKEFETNARIIGTIEDGDAERDKE
jgi:hypothetical protein